MFQNIKYKMGLQFRLTVLIILVNSSTSQKKIDYHILQGKSVAFECNTNSNILCQFYQKDKLVVDRNTDDKNNHFKIRNLHSCIIDIANVRLEDNGNYNCAINETQYNLIVHVKPEKFEMLLHQPIENSEMVSKILVENDSLILPPSKLGQVAFSCHSYGGDMDHRIEWVVDGKIAMSYDGQKTRDIYLKDMMSTNYVDYRIGKSNIVMCSATGVGFEPIRLIATLGLPYSTNKVVLRDRSNGTDRILLKGEERKIMCEANGLPVPKDFVIKQKINQIWTAVTLNNWYIVKETGSYICEARNTDINANLMENYIASEPLQFFHHEMKQLDIENQLGDMQNKLSELSVRQMRMLELLYQNCKH